MIPAKFQKEIYRRKVSPPRNPPRRTYRGVGQWLVVGYRSARRFVVLHRFQDRGQAESFRTNLAGNPDVEGFRRFVVVHWERFFVYEVHTPACELEKQQCDRRQVNMELVHAFLLSWQRDHGRPPRWDIVRTGLGLSRYALRYVLQNLRAAGLVVRKDSRSIGTAVERMVQQ